MLLDDARETMRSESINRRRTMPFARAPQISPIVLISLLYILSLYAFYRQGLIGETNFIGTVVVLVCVVMLFYGAFYFGLNNRFSETSLMLPQLVAALSIMMALAHVERTTQIALVPFILIAFSFGIFRLSTGSLTLLSVGCLGAYLGIIMMRGDAQSYSYGFRTDLVQWFVLALTLPGMIIVGKQIQNLRQMLKVTRYQLEHYEEKSVRDELTGLYNRRHIQTELEQAKLQADTRSTPFSICLIDIDRFKEINDNHGHLTGDTILREFARVALDSIRDTDTLGRYGGAVHGVVLPVV